MSWKVNRHTFDKDVGERALLVSKNPMKPRKLAKVSSHKCRTNCEMLIVIGFGLGWVGLGAGVE